VIEYVASTNGKLELHYLPGYAPELNPDELVWNYMKRTVLAAPLNDTTSQAPETALATVPGLQPRSIGFMRLEGAEISDG
jgi:hypothetical protein